MLKVENLTSQLQEHIFSCVTEDNLVMIVTLTIAAFFFFFFSSLFAFVLSVSCCS